MRAHKSSSRVGGTEEDGDEDEDALARARALEVEEDARAMVEDLLLGPGGRKLGDVNAIFTLDNTGRRTKIWTSTWKDFGKNGRLVDTWVFRRLVVSESDCITQVSFNFFNIYTSPAFEAAFLITVTALSRSASS